MLYLIYQAWKPGKDTNNQTVYITNSEKFKRLQSQFTMLKNDGLKCTCFNRLNIKLYQLEYTELYIYLELFIRF